MSTIRYRLKRNEAIKTTYAEIVRSTTNITFDDLCDETADYIGQPKELVRAIGEALMKVAYRNVRKGFRVEIADMLSFYAKVHKSVVDKIDPSTGEIIPPTPDELTPNGRDGELRCEVHKKINKHFCNNVHWERVDD